MIHRLIPALMVALVSASCATVAHMPANQSKQKAEVIIYSAKSCGYCDKAKKFFEDKNVSYKIIDIQWKKDLIDEMEKKTGKRSVPQIMINGRHIGGYVSLMTMDFTGELDDMLAQGPSIVDQKVGTIPISATK